MGSDGRSDENGHPKGGEASAATGHQARPTLNSAVPRRRADRAFSLRLAGAIRQNERALQRLKR